MKTNIKLLLIIGSLDVGGAERHLLRTLPTLCNYGYSITVWTLTHRGQLSQKFEDNGIKVLSAFNNVKTSQASKPVRILRLVVSCLELYRYLRNSKPDIVHFFLPTAYLIGGIVSIAAGQKIMVMSRRCMNNYQKRHPLFLKLETRLHKHMASILCNSKVIESQLLKENIPKEKVNLIYNGITIRKKISNENRLKIRNNIGVNENVLLFIMVANYIPYKGHLDLIKAIGMAKEHIHREWRLLLVGRDDGIKNSLVMKVKNEDMDSKVIFTEEVDNVLDLIAASDISLLSSHEEGFSNSLLESMAEGLPVIATDVGGNSELVDNNMTGLIVPPKNSNELCNAIIKLSNNEKMRYEMGSLGKKRVSECFSQEKCIDMYDDIYRRLISNL